MSPITPEGILTYDFLTAGGLDAAAAVQPIYTAQTITGVIMAIAAFVYYKGYKTNPPAEGEAA